MDIKLVVEQGRTSIRTLRLHSSQTLIGRAHGCQVRIPSALVSRRHCLLDVCDGIVTVEDLNSRNGTLLNGETVTGQRLVRPGDHLQIGPITFIVEYLIARKLSTDCCKRRNPARTSNPSSWKSSRKTRS